MTYLDVSKKEFVVDSLNRKIKAKDAPTGRLVQINPILFWIFWHRGQRSGLSAGLSAGLFAGLQAICISHWEEVGKFVSSRNVQLLNSSAASVAPSPVCPQSLPAGIFIKMSS